MRSFFLRARRSVLMVAIPGALGTSSPRAQTVTGSAAGTYALQFERLGYQSVVLENLALEGGAPETLFVRLAASAVSLEAVTVSAAEVQRRERYLQNAGFYRRKAAEPGVFLDPAAVAGRVARARHLADLLRAIPGVSILLTDRGSRGSRRRPGA